MKLLHQYLNIAQTYVSLQCLSKVINCTLNTGIFPQRLKVAKVIPIYKNGAHNLITNYRPISTLNIFAKIYEKVIYARLENYMAKKQILTDKQFGLRKNLSDALAPFIVC